MRTLFASCVVTGLFLVGCAGVSLPDLGGSAAPPPAPTPPPVAPVTSPTPPRPDAPSRFDAMMEIDGVWQVPGRCPGETLDHDRLEIDDQHRFLFAGAYDAEVIGTVTGTEATAEGFVIHVTRPNGTPSDETLRWGDGTHAWVAYRDGRYAPAPFVGTKVPLHVPTVAQCARGG